MLLIDVARHLKIPMNYFNQRIASRFGLPKILTIEKIHRKKLWKCQAKNRFGLKRQTKINHSITAIQIYICTWTLVCFSLLLWFHTLSHSLCPNSEYISIARTHKKNYTWKYLALCIYIYNDGCRASENSHNIFVLSSLLNWFNSSDFQRKRN